MKQSFYEIFSELNKVSRPSHHEGKVADWLCQFAEKHGLKYRRDAENCVVIEKPATPGYEDAAPVVILNHMDMVCVAKDDYLRDGRKFDPMNDEIRAYVETDENGVRWMKAEGTSLGADNGVGLSMALAVLTDDSLVHPALEVLTTTNEEDGMSGAEALSLDFIKGRKIVNLDSEDYDTVTVGAAGAFLQVAHWTPTWKQVPEGYVYRRIVIDGGLGGHSGLDVHKKRCNCNRELGLFMCGEPVNALINGQMVVCTMNGGTANASISSNASAVVAIDPAINDALADLVAQFNETLKTARDTDPGINIRIEEAAACDKCLDAAVAINVLRSIHDLPCGVIEMHKEIPGTVMTSNNVGVLHVSDDDITVSCHTRSFSNDEMHRYADAIKETFESNHATVKQLMDTGSWFEDPNSTLLETTCNTFKDVLGFEPNKIAIHAVLECAYFVQKYPGVQIASIGPLIIEPHSTSERINLDTADNIWKVVVELLKRLAAEK
ncbi:MAG: beta-Ala-His dipeptidase [Muribaculaceae bacterium]|nr:beta-Ala-His dipeptidase [Muribaculaceae bacterium]